jgi:hypothetical protein
MNALAGVQCGCDVNQAGTDCFRLIGNRASNWHAARLLLILIVPVIGCWVIGNLKTRKIGQEATTKTAWRQFHAANSLFLNVADDDKDLSNARSSAAVLG